MSNQRTGDAERSDTINRRRTLAAIGAGAASAAFGIGSLAGTAAAWGRFDVEFRECKTVRMIVGNSDLYYEPPAVARVIVESDGDAECRTVEFTEENAETIDEYGEDPVVTYEADGEETILGVLSYNIAPEEDGRFSRPRCIMLNDNECARGWDMPDIRHSDCVRNAIWEWREFTECWWDPTEWSGPADEDEPDEETSTATADQDGSNDNPSGDDSNDNPGDDDSNDNPNDDDSNDNPSDDGSDESAVMKSIEDSPGLGVGSALASLGGAGYLLFRRLSGEDEP